ncbi:Kynurenine 3-monooxygenase [Beauveria bassiana]|nr:Kynurenine 3-monooxygenase [Beauveria bassiana]
MLRADGAHSAVRYHMMKTSRMDYQHECLDVVWCELRMKPGKVRGDTAHAWKISPSHRHMWSAEDSMFIATPNEALEGFMHATFPSLGWQSKYSRVVFSNEPYAECVRRNDRQDRLLSIFTAGPFVAAGLYALWSAVTAPWQWPGFRRHVLSVALGV